jgi:hypothetical protein
MRIIRRELTRELTLLSEHSPDCLKRMKGKSDDSIRGPGGVEVRLSLDSLKVLRHNNRRRPTEFNAGEAGYAVLTVCDPHTPVLTINDKDRVVGIPAALRA